MIHFNVCKQFIPRLIFVNICIYLINGLILRYLSVKRKILNTSYYTLIVSDGAEHEKPSKKDLLGRRKDKKEKKDRGYAALEGESSPEEDTDTK